MPFSADFLDGFCMPQAAQFLGVIFRCIDTDRSADGSFGSVGALMIGKQTEAEPNVHWSSPPNVEVVVPGVFSSLNFLLPLQLPPASIAIALSRNFVLSLFTHTSSVRPELFHKS